MDLDWPPLLSSMLFRKKKNDPWNPETRAVLEYPVEGTDYLSLVAAVLCSRAAEQTAD